MAENINNVTEVHEEVPIDAVQETHAETGSENVIDAVAGQFGLNLPHFTAQLLNFTIVMVVLWLFVYKPVVRMLDERKEKIEKSMKQAEEIELRITEIEKERETVITEAKKAAQEIAEKAHNEGEARRTEIIEAAKREVERVISKGKQQLAQEKTDMMRELRKNIVDISVKASARILNDQIDESKSQSLAEEVVRKMT